MSLQNKFYGVIVGVFIAMSAHAEQVSSAMSITADQFSFDQATGMATYRGHVVLLREGVKLYADELSASSLDGSAIEKITAKGAPLTFFLKQPTQGNVDGQAQQAEYYLKKEILELKGAVKITQQKPKVETNVIEAQHIVVQFTEKREVKNIQAFGEPVRYQQQPYQPNAASTRASAKQINYDALKQTVELEDQADLEQGLQRMQADRIRYDMQKKSGEAVGSKNKPVQTIWSPEKKPEQSGNPERKP